MADYTVLAAPVTRASEAKRSEFLTFLHPVIERAEAMAWVNHYKSTYPDANHVCWAYVIGNTRQPLTQAFSDDGEPSGTAGKPMLHVLTEREVGNALAIVVRYFGGVKLGAGGLVRAYSAAVSDAVGEASLTQVIETSCLEITAPFAREARVRHLIQECGGAITQADYAQAVILHCTLPKPRVAESCQRISEACAGEAVIREL